MKHEQSELQGTEQESFEKELRRLRPVRLPEQLLNRLAALRTPENVETQVTAADRASQTVSVWWVSLRRWLLPVAGAAMAMLLLASGWVWRASKPGTEPIAPADVPANTLNADQVEIDRQWIASFDAIASLPDGEPVRVRFNEWQDQVRFRDSARGVTVEKRTPRFEVVPVRFETD